MVNEQQLKIILLNSGPKAKQCPANSLEKGGIKFICVYACISVFFMYICGTDWDVEPCILGTTQMFQSVFILDTISYAIFSFVLTKLLKAKNSFIPFIFK